jgi:O-antigen ligase
VHIVLAALVFSGILTLWIPDYWPVAMFQVGVFTLATASLWQSRDRFPRLAYPIIPLGIAPVWAVVQWTTGRTTYAFATQTAAVHWATFLAVLLTGIHLFRNEPVRHWFRSAMLWFAFILAVVATLQTFSSEGKVFWLFPSGYTDFVMGPILYRNHYAAFIEAVIPIAVYEALRRETRSLLYSGMAAAMYASIVASSSRAGTILASAEVLLVMALMWVRGRVSGRAVGMSLLKIGVTIIAFVMVVGWDVVWERFRAPDPMVMRREFVISTVHMIQDHPWTGVGLGTWPTVYPRYAIVDFGVFANQAHNDWLQWTAEGGLPFGLLMAGVFFWCARAGFRSIWGLGAIAVLLHALVDYPFSRPALGSWTVLIIAMLASARELPITSGGAAAGVGAADG